MLPRLCADTGLSDPGLPEPRRSQLHQRTDLQTAALPRELWQHRQKQHQEKRGALECVGLEGEAASKTRDS